MKPGIKAVAVVAAVFLFLLIVMDKVTKFAAVIRPVRRRRGVGDFGAFRSAHPDKPHQGQDYMADPGDAAFSPIAGTVRVAQPYPGDPRYSGVEITSPSGMYRVKVFYILPDVKTGDRVAKGQYIGQVQDLSLKYGASFLPQNHVHVEVRRYGIVANPDGYFPEDTVLVV